MPDHPFPSPPPFLLPRTFSLLLLSLLPHLPAAFPLLPNPDPVTIQQQQQPFHPKPLPPSTIPSFPEQSSLSPCPLHLPDPLFPAARSSCPSGHLRRGQCCPVLAAWLYSSYSHIALYGRLPDAHQTASTYENQLPVLPDDSETCVDGLEKVMSEKGVNLMRPNETCDVVYCFCGIRLHPLTCPQAFEVDDDGLLVGGERVKQLERDCLKHDNDSKLTTCSKCIKSLYSLKKGDSKRANITKSDSRTSKMRSRDCELMGLTWLLNKNRDLYISTVTEVIRAQMMNTQGSNLLSCSLKSDGMPLAVDSNVIDDQSSSVALPFPFSPYLLSFFLLIAYQF